MNIRDFFHSLLPGFSRSNYASALANSIKRCEETSIPLYEEFNLKNKRFNFKHSSSKAFNEIFNRSGLRNKVATDLMGTIEKGLRNMVVIGREVEKFFTKHPTDEVYKNGLSYNEEQHIQLVAAIDWCERYSRKFFTVLVCYELAQYQANPNYLKEKITDNQLTYVREYFPGFIALMLSFAANKPEKILALFKAIPTIIVQPASVDEIIAVHGRNKMDPLNFGLISANWNPVFMVGKLVVEYQKRRYDEAKMDLETCRLQILALENEKAGTPSPSLDKQIEYFTNKKQSLEAEIYDYEQSLED